MDEFSLNNKQLASKIKNKKFAHFLLLIAIRIYGITISLLSSLIINSKNKKHETS